MFGSEAKTTTAKKKKKKYLNRDLRRGNLLLSPPIPKEDAAIMVDPNGNQIVLVLEKLIWRRKS